MSLMTGRRALMASGMALVTPALGQPFPNRPIRLVVPFAPGGQTDLLARLLAPRLTAQLGQSVLVDNRAGGSTMIGAENVAHAPKDGHAVLFGGPSAVVTNPLLFSRMPYKVEDLAPVVLLSSFPYIMSVRSSMPATDVRSFVAHVRAQPEGITYGSIGRGSSTHISAEILSDALGIRMVDVIYRGLAPAQNDLISGTIDGIMDAFGQAIPYHESGRYRIIGSMGRSRWPTMPQIETFAEAGYPKAVYESWYGMFVPTGTPAEAIRRLNAAFNDVLAEPDMRRLMLQQGQLGVGGEPAALTAIIAEDVARTAEVVQRLGLHLD